MLDLDLTTYGQTKKIYKEITQNQIKKMSQELFDFSKCTIIEVGDVPRKKLEDLVKKYFTR